MSEGSTRVISNLKKGALCPHLKEFKIYFWLIEGIPNLGDSSSSDEELNVPDTDDEIYLPREKVTFTSNCVK